MSMQATAGPDHRSRSVDSLFRQHHFWLRSWLSRQPRTIACAEDIASEVFVRLMSLSNLEELIEPRAMMTTVARRVIYELRRRNDLWRSYETDLLALPAGLVASPEDQVIVMQALRAVDEMLNGLSPIARAAFLYSRVDGMKHEEIAARLNISMRRVRRYISSGLERAYVLKQEMI